MVGERCGGRVERRVSLLCFFRSLSLCHAQVHAKKKNLHHTGSTVSFVCTPQASTPSPPPRLLLSSCCCVRPQSLLFPAPVCRPPPPATRTLLKMQPPPAPSTPNRSPTILLHPRSNDGCVWANDSFGGVRWSAWVTWPSRWARSTSSPTSSPALCEFGHSFP